MPQLSSSARDVSAQTTIKRAGPVAHQLGVTRCAEVTWLDYIGIPVFCATRPRAAIVCVTAGKGLNKEEAHAGALMESIEHAVAEGSAVAADVTWATPAEVARQGGLPLDSLCPRIGENIDPELSVPWVLAHDITGDRDLLLPPDLVFIPCPKSLQHGYFGSVTTGLGSGNTEAEAVLHGLCEVIEHDATSFENLGARSALVDPTSLPSEPMALYQAIRDAGLRVWLRSMSPAVGVAYLSCLIVDDDFDSPLRCNGGYGCHPVSSIAAVRALAEAAQSRLTYIQGARDDLSESYSFIESMTHEEQHNYRNALIRRFSDDRYIMSFREIPGTSSASPIQLLNRLVESCCHAAFTPIAVYSFPPFASPFHVVKVVVPGAEDFSNSTRRVGRRLAAFARAGRVFDPRA